MQRHTAPLLGSDRRAPIGEKVRLNFLFFAIGLGALVWALGLMHPEASQAGNCPYGGNYIECLQAGETVDYCKQYVLNCEPDPDPSQDGSDQTGGGDPDPSGDDCPYGGNYIECLQAGRSVDFCKRYVLNCDDGQGSTGAGGGSSGGSGDPCQVFEDEAGVGCDGNPTWVDLGELRDLVMSETTTCPYDSYVECLQAGETVEFCKRHVLNCEPGALTEASVTVDYDARQCVSEPFCLCAQAAGTITFYGVTVIKDDEVCFEVSSFDYQGPFQNRVEQEIIAELDAIGWEMCLPLECL